MEAEAKAAHLDSGTAQTPLMIPAQLLYQLLKQLGESFSYQ